VPSKISTQICEWTFRLVRNKAVLPDQCDANVTFSHINRDTERRIREFRVGANINVKRERRARTKSVLDNIESFD